MKLYDIDRFLQRRGPPQVSLEHSVLGKQGRRKYNQPLACPGISSRGRAKPSNRINQSAFICNLSIGCGQTNNNAPPA